MKGVIELIIAMGNWISLLLGPTGKRCRMCLEIIPPSDRKHLRAHAHRLLFPSSIPRC